MAYCKDLESAHNHIKYHLYIPLLFIYRKCCIVKSFKFSTPLIICKLRKHINPLSYLSAIVKCLSGQGSFRCYLSNRIPWVLSRGSLSAHSTYIFWEKSQSQIGLKGYLLFVAVVFEQRGNAGQVLFPFGGFVG